MAKAMPLVLFMLLVSVFAEELETLPFPHSPTPAPLHPPTYPPANAPHHHHHHHHQSPAPAPLHPPSPPTHPHYPPTPAHPPTHHHHHHPSAPVHPPLNPPVPVHPPLNPPVPVHPPLKPPAPVHPPLKPPVPVHPPLKPPVSVHPPHKSPVPVHPPVKPPVPVHSPVPVHPPVHPPVRPFPRSFVAVQGVVYVKSCKYAGVDTLLGATPLLGAVVKLQCNNTKYKLVQTTQSDKNGYFYVEAPKLITTYGAHKCNVVLVKGPNGLKPSNLHGGVTGALLRPEKPFMYQKLPFVLYTVGPLAFEPKCH